ncbi:unnamed protein product [marine sediment metagenome]|uniref:Uncharacterized protein n=1 Tax=marine sediment metagenome TaxID=412755 RepID=X0TF98_9ZZZZ
MPNKFPVERYRPAALPDIGPALLTHLYDEFTRISQALIAFPVALNVNETQLGVPVTTIPTEFRLFEGVDATLDLPGGDWDSVLGEYKVPTTGLFQINLNSTSSAVGAGNKDWQALVRLYVDDVEIWGVNDSGQDDFPLTCQLSVSGRLVRDSIVRASIELVHEQFVGSTTVTAFMNLTQVAQE